MPRCSNRMSSVKDLFPEYSLKVISTRQMVALRLPYLQINTETYIAVNSPEGLLLCIHALKYLFSYLHAETGRIFLHSVAPNLLSLLLDLCLLPLSQTDRGVQFLRKNHAPSSIVEGSAISRFSSNFTPGS